MPLRDHFCPPTTDFASWEELHGAWPGMIACRLKAFLPPARVELNPQIPEPYAPHWPRSWIRA